MPFALAKDWKKILSAELKQPSFIRLIQTLEQLRLSTSIFPPPKLVFNAFNQCQFNQTKVVILGQDPYHKVGQAHGLAFSVPDGVTIPPSLRNIFKEIINDVNITMPSSGNLTSWSKQGVLLLNCLLTVEANKAGSHQDQGWGEFTDAVISHISQEKEKVVFLLWGSFAISKQSFIDKSRHLVLTAPHPSPLSAYRGFFSCKHFSQTNAYLKKHGQTEIIW